MIISSVAALLLSGAIFAPPKLSIVIYHAEAVPAAELLRAEIVAHSILRQAGIETRWRPATAGDVAPGPDEIAVHLLSVHPSNLAPEISGYALLMSDGSYAGISCPAVRASAATLESDSATLLGAVMAHELGHILLRTRDHSTSGVMVRHLGSRQIHDAARGELQFLRSEARRMRAEAARRGAASKNVIEELHDAHVRNIGPAGHRHAIRTE
jgi:hypothetical protein